MLASRRTLVDRARLHRDAPLSISLFTAHFGVNVSPAKLGLDRYGLIVLPDWMTSLNQTGENARMFSTDPRSRLPSYGLANYGAIDSGLAGDGPILVSVAGLDRFDNWAALSPEDEKDRRARWLDAFQAALDRDYPGFARRGAVERLLLNAAQFYEHARSDLRLCALVIRARDLGRRSAPAQDADPQHLPCFVLGGVGRLQRRGEVGSGHGADGDEGARIRGRLTPPLLPP